MHSARSSPDLVATAALTLVGCAVALVPVEPWMKVVLLVPMVLVLPGYAVAAALLPRGALPLAERSVYTMALSVAVTVLSGVVVQLVTDLDRATWAALLTSVTLVASVVALRRREGDPEAERQPPRRLPGVSPISILAILVAIGIGAWAISIASQGARDDKAKSHFTELWTLPVRSAIRRGGPDAVSVGVENRQGIATSYDIRILLGGVRIATRAIRLGNGERWHAVFGVPRITPARPLRVTLLREGKVYRHTQLESGLPS